MTYYMLLSLIIFSGGHTVTIVGAESYAPTITCGVSARQGRRPTMEDRHTIKQLSEGLHFFGVYDGHGGTRAADFTRDNLHQNFSQAKNGTVRERLTHAPLKTDKDFLEQCKDDESGTTAVVAVVDTYVNKLFVANVGDSRAILTRKGKVLLVTKDHKPETELERIKNAGGHVYRGRVNDILAVSRAIGDRDLKEVGVIPDPDIYEKNIQEGDILVLACDGVWDVMNNEEVAIFVHEMFSKPNNEEEIRFLETSEEELARHEKLDEGGCQQVKLIARALRNEAHSQKSRDNISVLIVKLGSLHRAKTELTKEASKEKAVKPKIKANRNNLKDASGKFFRRLFKSIAEIKGIKVIALGLGVVTILYSLYRLRKRF